MKETRPCLHCQSLPELRTDNKDDRFWFMFICPTCQHHAGAHLSESVALHWWNKVNEEQRPCLGCHGQPRVKYSKLRDMWTLQCTGCGYVNHWNHTLQGAVCGWHTSNTPGEVHYKKMWDARYEELQKERELAAKQIGED
ncbi:hypothetical protein K6U16_15030 [Vibrio parahaemolyticus]|uniref:hypothetical protein n=1 Tax=Vibrio parahaemolyticus TaxID=670 RepID=UPI001D43563D|nr:hypothetical protein [Vibrio parahaemolyticus]EGG0282910.1 hypothetical protein [Salmonella enterica]EGQ8456723.1 hypothetical protein [Vibrio parahaemolyticus]EGQ8464328.1 hypothetical protein [Vibrio parahaemolyticus]EGQ9405915.1 hypothetical protein [Vibrio parahaemolyticus]EGR0297526.1 hypothetical protein [Vibrio parahaemolyticus]